MFVGIRNYKNLYTIATASVFALNINFAEGNETSPNASTFKQTTSPKFNAPDIVYPTGIDSIPPEPTSPEAEAVGIEKEIFPDHSFSNFGDFGIWLLQQANSTPSEAYPQATVTPQQVSTSIPSEIVYPPSTGSIPPSNSGSFGTEAVKTDKGIAPQLRISPYSEDTTFSKFSFNSFSDFNLRIHSETSELHLQSIIPTQQLSTSTIPDIACLSGTDSIPSPNPASSGSELDDSNNATTPQPETSTNSDGTPFSLFLFSNSFSSFSDFYLRMLPQANSAPSDMQSKTTASSPQPSTSPMSDIVQLHNTDSIPSPNPASSGSELDGGNNATIPQPSTSLMPDIVCLPNTDSIPSPNTASSKSEIDGGNNATIPQPSASTMPDIVCLPNTDSIPSPNTASPESELDGSNNATTPQTSTSPMPNVVHLPNTDSIPSPNPAPSGSELDGGNEASTPTAETSEVSDVIFPNIQETREEENALTFDIPPQKRSRRSQPKCLTPSAIEVKNLNKALAIANSKAIKSLKTGTIAEIEESLVTKDCDSETFLAKYAFSMLNIENAKIEAASQDFLKQLWRCICNQRRVTITDAISSEDLAFLLEVLSKQIPLNFLKLLRLGDEEPTEIIIKITNALIYNQTLKKLDLSNCRILNNSKEPKQEISLLGRVISTSCLEELVLQDNRIEYLNEIAKALKTSNTLKILNLSNNNIRGAGARTLSKALKDCKLSTLILSFNYIGNSGVKALVEALKTSKLKNLDLSGGENEIEDLSKIEVLNDASIFLTVDSKYYCITKDGVEETRGIRRNSTGPTVDF